MVTIQTKNPLATGSFWLGILSLILGMVIIASPGFASLLSLGTSILIGWIFLIGGIVGVIASFAEKGGEFWFSLIISLLMVVAGWFLAFDPLEGALAMTVILASLFLIVGIAEFIFAFAIEGGVKWAFMLSGILSIIIAIMIFSAWPLAGIWFIGFLIGVKLFFTGISEIALSFSK